MNVEGQERLLQATTYSILLPNNNWSIQIFTNGQRPTAHLKENPSAHAEKQTAAALNPLLAACTRVAILLREGTRVTRTEPNHHDSSAPGIQPPDHTAKPELHRSVPLYFHPTLGHTSRKGSIAVARASPSSLTTGTRQRKRMQPHSFRRSSTISSDEHTNTETQIKKPDRRKEKKLNPKD
ncbi:hypothetical protein YC2023_064973 [Brassica napus]